MAASDQMILGGIWVYWCWLNIGVAIYDLVVRCGLGGGMPGDIRRYSHVHARPQHSPPPETPAALPLDPIF